MTHDNMAGMDHSKMNHQDVGTASTPALASTESVYLTNGKWTDQTHHIIGLKKKNNCPFILVVSSRPSAN